MRKKITICLGGINNTRAIQVSFNIQATQEEMDVIDALAQQINGLSINAHAPVAHTKTNLMRLNQFLYLLTEYPGMTYQYKLHLRAGMSQFFQNEINHMPHHKTEPGHLGYDAYQAELRAIHQMLHMFKKTLNLVNLPNLPEPIQLALYDAAPSPPTYPLQALPELPETLEAFAESIALTKQCKNAWETRLREYAIPYLEGYFQNITDSIQILAANSPREARVLVSKIIHFSENLNSKPFSINMMRDIARISLSPVKTIRRGPSVSSTVEAEKKSDYITEYQQLLQLLTHCIDSPQSSDNFQNAFKTFETHFLMMLEKYPLKKYDLSTRSKRDLGHYTHADTNRYSIGYYLEHLDRHLHNPIPAHALRELNKLKTEYGAPGCTARQQRKLQFFDTLEKEIRAHPEKSYRECITLIKNTPQDLYKSLFRPRAYLSGYHFFNHRFETWVDGLESLDPPKLFCKNP